MGLTRKYPDFSSGIAAKARLNINRANVIAFQIILKRTYFSSL
ncbi:hypothetical protein SAMN06297358_4033 [Pedobacter xixiisoli]|uniref:Uncharacterized protein n=1 Tax=Pedobacter xixiisoli TaxID=1476464 RepID=A0A286AEJ1_9SPHI|nr:hypothetical protein SAMN06297358_4033 [Pedobacter xixiisoli]